MVLVKILRRKDASSVIVAVIIAMVVGQMLAFMSSDWAARLSGLKNNEGFQFGPTGNWRVMYLQPFVTAILQLLALEILVWIYIFAHSLVAKKK
jgi:hypothetical protein